MQVTVITGKLTIICRRYDFVIKKPLVWSMKISRLSRQMAYYHAIGAIERMVHILLKTFFFCFSFVGFISKSMRINL